MTLNQIIEHIGIEPYYREDAGVIYNADCLDILSNMPDNCVDLVVTDPPYGGIVGNYNRKPLIGGVAKRDGESRSIGQPWKPINWYPDASRIAIHGLITFCGHKDVDEIPSRFPSMRKVCLLTWEEINAAPTGRNVPRFTTQFAWVFAKGSGYDFGSIKKTCFHYPHQPGGCMKTDRPDHPCPKPPKLMYDILTQFSVDLILDPFIGSGTTAIAAKQSGRQIIGIEIERKYCNIAVQRLAQEVLL